MCFNFRSGGGGGKGGVLCFLAYIVRLRLPLYLGKIEPLFHCCVFLVFLIFKVAGARLEFCTHLMQRRKRAHCPFASVLLAGCEVKII